MCDRRNLPIPSCRRPPMSRCGRAGSPALRCARRWSPRRCSTPLTGARVFLKAETLQRTGSFKFRGAYNKLSSIPPDEARRRRGRVLLRQSRAGRGARRRSCSNMPAVIVMPSDAPRPKRERTAALRRRGRALRSRAGGSRGHRARHCRAARRDAGAALRRSASSSRARARPAARSWRTWRRSGSTPDVVVIGASGGGTGGRHLARHQVARAGGADLHRRAGRLRRHRALVPERQARDTMRASPARSATR